MTTTSELIHRAIDLSDEERYAEAIALLSRAISIDPTVPQAYFERGIALLNLGQNADAAADFDRALNLDPNFPGARDWRSRVAESLGDFRLAANERLKDLRSNPEGPLGMGVSPQAWADCACALLNAGEHDTALSLLEEYFDTYVHKVTNYLAYETAPMRLFARLLADSGRSDESLHYAHQAYSSTHKVPMDILTYALALESASRWEDARRICSEALAVNAHMPGLRELQARLAQPSIGA